MFRLVVLTFAVAACAVAQQNAAVDPKNAKILKEQRFNAGDGRAGASFATEDGVVFKEETDESGNRIGQYSYIGADGVTYNVKYSAGKDGFRILSGDHIPSGGQTAAAFDAQDDAAAEEAEAAALQKSAPLVPQAPAQRAQPAQPLPAQRAPASIPDYDDAPTDPNFNPFINPHDPTHLNFQQNTNAKTFNPNSPLAQASSLVPPCADCAGVDPFVNPFDSSHRAGGDFSQAGHLAGHLAGHQAGQQQPQPQQRAQPQQPQQSVPSPQLRQQPLNLETTPQPKRFFPPGQLSLNRFENGFNFDFES
jgi:hypothetical protein